MSRFYNWSDQLRKIQRAEKRNEPGRCHPARSHLPAQVRRGRPSRAPPETGEYPSIYIIPLGAAERSPPQTLLVHRFTQPTLALLPLAV